MFSFLNTRTPTSRSNALFKSITKKGLWKCLELLKKEKKTILGCPCIHILNILIIIHGEKTVEFLHKAACCAEWTKKS